MTLDDMASMFGQEVHRTPQFSVWARVTPDGVLEVHTFRMVPEGIKLPGGFIQGHNFLAMDHVRSK